MKDRITVALVRLLPVLRRVVWLALFFYTMRELLLDQHAVVLNSRHVVRGGAASLHRVGPTHLVVVATVATRPGS